ncbi:MAG: DUF6252 family protein [Ferruginibacter sp.]
MKYTLITLAGLFMLISCNSQQGEANKTAAQIQQQVNQNSPANVTTNSTGYYMKATVNGKEWIADAVTPPEAAGRIVGKKNMEYIGLPYNKQYLIAGKKIALGEDEAVDISFTGVGLAITKNGEMEITKVDENWAEGIFHFTATISGTDKIVEVTQGSFRIKIK